MYKLIRVFAQPKIKQINLRVAIGRYWTHTTTRNGHELANKKQIIEIIEKFNTYILLRRSKQKCFICLHV